MGDSEIKEAKLHQFPGLVNLTVSTQEFPGVQVEVLIDILS